MRASTAGLRLTAYGLRVTGGGLFSLLLTPYSLLLGSVCLLGILGIACSLMASEAQADEYRIAAMSQWEKWSFPQDVVDLRAGGGVGLVRVRGMADSVNACLDAHEFKHIVKDKNTPGFIPIERSNDGYRYGGILWAPSNTSDAEHVIDGRKDTWWKPAPEDTLEDWWIDVDLGRVVPATKIRLVFPDTEGARPFEQFSVYYSNGDRPSTASDIFIYELAGKTTKPNTRRVVEYDLRYARVDTDVEGQSITRRLDFQMVQYVRVILAAKSKDAALAEVEVYTLGDNLALRTFERGGSIDAHTAMEKAPSIFDGYIGSYWQFPLLTDQDWNTWQPPTWQPWFIWDLGALFWVDQVLYLSGGPTMLSSRSGLYPEGYILKTSDGTRTPDGQLDFEDLVDVYNLNLPYQYNWDHRFEPRKVRYIFFRHAHGIGNVRSRGNLGSYLHEILVFGQGYPAEVTLTSDFIDLGTVKNITAIAWDADMPPGTRIEVYSQSGDSLLTLKHYYDKYTYEEVSEEQYYSSKFKVRQGDIVEEIVPDPSSWSNWSEAYHFSGESFLSPSPRRYTRLRVHIKTDDPEVTPVLRSISLIHTPPLLNSIRAQIEPRAVPADLPQRFVYRLWPGYASGNKGFDQVWIKTPSQVIEDSVFVSVRGASISPDSIGVKRDTLFIQLPQVVRRDSVDVQFVCRVRKNQTAFDALIGNIVSPEARQRVDPAEKGATIVAVPSLPGRSNLIGNLVIEPRVITPNNDGLNDEAAITFSVFKVDRTPEIIIYDLQGRAVRELMNPSEPGETRYIWDGRDHAGKKVPPGVYVCRIRVDADAGNNVAVRSIGVSY